jgi:hypothetical protein
MFTCQIIADRDVCLQHSTASKNRIFTRRISQMLRSTAQYAFVKFHVRATREWNRRRQKRYKLEGRREI